MERNLKPIKENKSLEESLMKHHMSRYEYMYSIELRDKREEEQRAILKASIEVARKLLQDMEK